MSNSAITRKNKSIFEVSFFHLSPCMLFVFQANRNCIAIASSHDIQELDVSAILATQIYTWVDDDIEIENKGYMFFVFSITL